MLGLSYINFFFLKNTTYFILKKKKKITLITLPNSSKNKLNSEISWQK